MMKEKTNKQTGATKPSRGQKSAMMKAKPGSMGARGGSMKPKPMRKQYGMSKKSSY